MVDPNRPEFDQVLFGIARDLIVRGDSLDLPRGWDRLRRQLCPDPGKRRTVHAPEALHERLTTDALDWWKVFAEGRIDIADVLTDLFELASGCQPLLQSHIEPVAHGLVAEFVEQQAFLISPDWSTYLVNIWIVATRLAEPEILRAHETATELDLIYSLPRLRQEDGSVEVQREHSSQRFCPEASSAAVQQGDRLWPQLCQLTEYIRHYQADRKKKRRIAARDGRSPEPTPYACIGCGIVVGTARW